MKGIGADRTHLLGISSGYGRAIPANLVAPNQVLVGDTHLHPAYSADAALVGAMTTPDGVYRFAKGTTVSSSKASVRA